MAFQDKYDFSLLVNEKERYVVAELETQLKVRTEVCRCQECVLDMVALALNHTRPVYRVTLLGAIYARAEDEEVHQEIVAAVQNAIEKIYENPSHARS
ncbi:MAG TPA: late competence development ComFB family protein [Spirochaetia bacterium]|jgi:competence protein ComFB|nr:late competence development ComFB family protein [Spirochaetia bacterium]